MTLEEDKAPVRRYFEDVPRNPDVCNEIFQSAFCRKPKLSFREARALPSYVQAGPAFFVEKSKRKMIAEDIRKALLIAD